MLTSHWFLIVLSQVDQIPQSRVELIHHTLCGWGQGSEQLLHSKYEHWCESVKYRNTLWFESSIYLYNFSHDKHPIMSRLLLTVLQQAGGRTKWSCCEENWTTDEGYSKKKQQDKSHYGAKCLCDKNIYSCWAALKDDGKSLRSLHKFTPKSRMQGIAKPPEETRGVDREPKCIKMEQYLSLNLMRENNNNNKTPPKDKIISDCSRHWAECKQTAMWKEATGLLGGSVAASQRWRLYNLTTQHAAS